MGHIVQPLSLIIFIYGFAICKEASCPTNWFGSNCQFLCHCEHNEACDFTGQCLTKCHKDWFGQKCQYQDLATIYGASITTVPSSQITGWLTDRDNETCNKDPSLLSVTVSWDQAYPVTWFRIQVEDPSVKLSLTFSFTTASKKKLTCRNQKIFVVNEVTIDYGCDVNDTVQELTVTGPGIQSLCSLYISGGRNVALRQRTEQTGVYYEIYYTKRVDFTSGLAVDGNTDSDLTHKSCSHTQNFPSGFYFTPSWTLIFDSPKEINRFVIYNRGDCCKERLQYFNLTALGTSIKTIWWHQDPNLHLIYNVTTPVKVVSGIRIYSTRIMYTGDTSPILTLCEVLVFGDCMTGSWEIDCENICPDECSISCHPETGICPEYIEYIESPTSKEVNKAGIGVGIGISAAIIIVIILIIIVRWRMNRNTSSINNIDESRSETYDSVRIFNVYSQLYESYSSSTAEGYHSNFHETQLKAFDDSATAESIETRQITSNNGESSDSMYHSIGLVNNTV